MARDLTTLAKETLLVQDACNLCGVAQAFARVLIDLGEHMNGTDVRNTHPIVRVWLDKLNQLAGMQDGLASAADWIAVQDWAEKGGDK